MSDIAIRCEALSKQYRIGERESYKALRDVITDGVSSPFRRLAQRGKSKEQSSNGSGNGPSPSAPSSRPSATFWALDDVSFEVKRGEVIGIIGRNGAGKSTLLKILSRITKPTKGHAEIHGRVGSLLEVGTGFHPELTGRENIYLNAAILGMRKAEIAKKFDEIVAFAEVEQFIDTPVKRYSSGMYVRLAFAVAAHMETEILLVDEVLAVGDAAFQKKCLGKLHDISKVGRAVLFVSHNMGAIARLCQRVICLESGKIIDDNLASTVIARYTSNIRSTAVCEVNLQDRDNLQSGMPARLLRAGTRDVEGNPANVFSIGESVVVEFDVEYQKSSSNFSHSVQVFNSDNTPLYNIWDIDFVTEQPPAANRRRIAVRIDDVSLYPDDYYLSLWIGDNGAETVDSASKCLRFSIVQGDQTLKWRLTKDKGLIWKSAYWSYGSS